MKKNINILAIETSCDDTCVSILSNGIIKSNVRLNQNKIHDNYNGVYPQIAASLHFENIDKTIKQALKRAKINLNEITHIAYTDQPGLKASLFIGKIAAQTISKLLNIPCYKINHLEGHLSSASINNEIPFPSLGLVISGGHTILYHLKNINNIEIICETNDDSIGEMFDKVGRQIGLKYPAGPIIDSLGSNFTSKLTKKILSEYKFNVFIPSEKKYFFSFSGLKTDAMNKISPKINKRYYCCALQHYAFLQLEKAILIALKKYNVKSIIVTGGVSANNFIRQKWTSVYFKNNDLKIIFPKKQYTVDNAAMIAQNLYNKL